MVPSYDRTNQNCARHIQFMSNMEKLSMIRVGNGSFRFALQFGLQIHWFCNEFWCLEKLRETFRTKIAPPGSSSLKVFMVPSHVPTLLISWQYNWLLYCLVWVKDSTESVSKNSFSRLKSIGADPGFTDIHGISTINVKVLCLHNFVSELLALRSPSSLLGDLFRELCGEMLQGVRGYLGGIWRSKEKPTQTYNQQNLRKVSFSV